MESLCEPCMREGRRVHCRFYCTDCEEVYCNACSKKHVMYKMALGHLIKPVNATDTSPDYQIYEQMSLLTSPLAHSGREDKNMAKDSNITNEYIDMSHGARCNSKVVDRYYLKDESDTIVTALSDLYSANDENCSNTTRMEVPNDQLLLDKSDQNDPYAKSLNTTLNLQIKNLESDTEKLSLNTEGTAYLHPIFTDLKATELKASESENEIYEKYPYSYAKVDSEANARVTDKTSTEQTTDRNGDKKIKTEDEKTDVHVYDEIDESLANAENIYKVNLIKSPFPVYELNGEFRLRFTTAGVELLHNRKMSRIYLWRLDTIRRHIMVPNHHLFRLEAGRRCGRWSGKFDFISESYKEMNEKLDSIYKETLEKSKKEKKNLKCK